MTPARNSSSHTPSRTAVVLEVFAWILRATLAGIFIYAGLIKSSDSEAFLISIAPLTFLPETLILLTGIALPWLEILAGVFLLIPPTTRLGALLILSLCSLFIAVLVWALSEDIVVACGCFGSAPDEAPTSDAMRAVIFRDALLAVAALALALKPRWKPRQPLNTDARHPQSH
ncbi:MAG: DoxX family membrane protein [Terrimicrobiaceae bacterium]